MSKSKKEKDTEDVSIKKVVYQDTRRPVPNDVGSGIEKKCAEYQTTRISIRC
jgi:hypothetical protein